MIRFLRPFTRCCQGERLIERRCQPVLRGRSNIYTEVQCRWRRRPSMDWSQLLPT